MPRSCLTRKHWRCLTWEKQHRRQPSPPLVVKQNFLNTPPNRDEETKSLTSSTAQVVEIKLLRAKPHMKIQNTRDQVGEKSTTSVKGKSLISLIRKELLKMENILLTKTQKIGKTTSKQFLIAALEAHGSIHKFNVDNSASLRRRGSSWNHYHDPRGTQPPRLQAFLLHPFFWGYNMWEPPSPHTSKCTDGVTVWRRHAEQRVSGTSASRVMGALVVWQSFRSYTWRRLSTVSPAMACRALGPRVGPRLLSRLPSRLWCGRCLLCLTCPVTQLGALPPSGSDLGWFCLVAKSCLTLSPPYGL